MKAVFEPVREKDLKRLNEIVNDPKVSRHLAISAPTTMSKTREFFEKTKNAQVSWCGIWVGAELAGSYSLNRGPMGSKVHHCASFGLAISPEHWGCGVGNEAIRHMIETAKDAGIRRVELLVDERNVRAQSLYLKNGFRFEGSKKNAMRDGKRYHDLYMMARIL